MLVVAGLEMREQCAKLIGEFGSYISIYTFVYKRPKFSLHSLERFFVRRVYSPHVSIITVKQTTRGYSRSGTNFQQGLKRRV